MKLSYLFLLGLLLFGTSISTSFAKEIVTNATYQASSEDNGASAALASDGNDQTQWCAAPKIGDSVFEDWWEVKFEKSPAPLGAIYMRSGKYFQNKLLGHKIRDFVWMYQKQGETAWKKIPEASMYANRYQLIFRFQPIKNIERLRLVINGRSYEELLYSKHNNPCLREVRFYSEEKDSIPTQPWFLGVSTWEDGNIYEPSKYFEPDTEDVRVSYEFAFTPAIHKALVEIRGKNYPDYYDEMTINEFSTKTKGYSNWILHEPAPVGFLFSGNFTDYFKRDPNELHGYFQFIKEQGSNTSMLGACGGHQLLAMALANKTFRKFKYEFTPDKLDQVDVTCSTDPAMHCGGIEAKFCCLEGGGDNPYREIAPNVSDFAMKNEYAGERLDMLFNLLPLHSGSGFKAFLWHTDFVNPKRIENDFDIIATYPKTVKHLSRRTPSLVQAMRYKNSMMYGTQFHWDEARIGECDRNEGQLNMERVEKNFVFMSLNILNKKNTYSVRASHSQADVSKVADLDKSTVWCGDKEADLVFKFQDQVPLKDFLLVDGEPSSPETQIRYEFSVSKDGHSWTPLEIDRRVSAYSIQEKSLQGCEKANSLSGEEDKQTNLVSLKETVTSNYLKLHLKSQSTSKACLREIFIFPFIQ